MKARKKLSNDNWKEVEYVQLQDSYVLTKANQMEFDVPIKVVRNSTQISEEEHWQGLRERAAIAALNGLLVDSEPKYMPSDFAKWSVIYADALIEELKKKQ